MLTKYQYVHSVEAPQLSGISQLELAKVLLWLAFVKLNMFRDHAVTDRTLSHPCDLGQGQGKQIETAIRQSQRNFLPKEAPGQS